MKHLVGQKILTVPEIPTSNGETFFKNFELDAIVPIETTDDYLVSSIQRIIRYKDKLILANASPPYIFIINHATGKVDAFINRYGQGPGESKYIMDIAFDDHREQILVYNDYEKLLFFDINAQFLREEKLEEIPLNMIYYEGKVLFKERGEGSSCYPYEFKIYDIEKKTLQTVGNSKRLDFYFKGYGRHLVKSKSIWFTAPLDYNLYKINNGDGDFEIPYTLEVKNPITERLREKQFTDDRSFYNEVSENKIIHTFSSIVETDRFILLNTNLSGFMMINKQTSEVTWEHKIKEEQLGGFSILNKIFPVDGEENRVMFIVDAVYWEKAVQIFWDKIAPKWQEQISKMNIVEDSNPILLFYKEKKEPE
jgi:hypothetical protein